MPAFDAPHSSAKLGAAPIFHLAQSAFRPATPHPGYLENDIAVVSSMRQKHGYYNLLILSLTRVEHRLQICSLKIYCFTGV
jgi:hypothetical protein